MRGNPRRRPALALPVRSIPACAGEPRAARHRHRSGKVYPRVCGGTPIGVCSLPLYAGLSPRVRGNRAIPGCRAGRRRSIPACAGEPATRRTRAMSRRVYPRVCGGTRIAFVMCHHSGGLSPRVRGNRLEHAGADCDGGSIPACAGEPDLRSAGHSRSMVYPRVCGGTSRVAGHSTCLSGLSPRVRGNHIHFQHGASIGRSIPACAGEPRRGRYGVLHRWVYPRVCGGT